MNREMQIIREVNIQAESFYKFAIELGNHAAYALGRVHRSQMTGLENIANSALKASDILDYIKRQTARFPYWQKGFPTSENPTTEAFGERLKKYIEGELDTKRGLICGTEKLNIDNTTDEGQQLRRHVYLLLIRQFLRQMVIQYEYCVNFENGKKGA